jgi:hypothetical protein
MSGLRLCRGFTNSHLGVIANTRNSMSTLVLVFTFSNLRIITIFFLAHTYHTRGQSFLPESVIEERYNLSVGSRDLIAGWKRGPACCLAKQNLSPI